MRLYHSRWLIFLIVTALLAGCTPPQVTQALIQVSITADGKEYQVQLPAGSTAQEALTQAGVVLTELDRTEPALYTVLSGGSNVRVVRVREEFYVEQVVIAFDNQTVLNESLPAGETRLSQPGTNGLQEITYRRVFEDDVIVSTSVVKTVTLQEAVPEILMVGSQTPFASLTIPGRITYLVAGNAWMMEGTTSNRRPVVTTGDLDGRVFSLSADGKWLVYTRSSMEENEINNLWAVKIDEPTPLIVDLQVSDVIHFAGWSPRLNALAYSTVEPRPTAPGWQANNDLYMVNISQSGGLGEKALQLEANSGGVYGWWGMDFAWGLDGLQLAYTRPDGVGLLDIRLDEVRSLMEIVPFQTGSDWAWVPGIGWGPDGKVLYTVEHVVKAGVASPEESPYFDLVAIPLDGGAPVSLVPEVGMFAYPSPSPMLPVEISPETEENPAVVENAYQVAYLQAIFATESSTSRYRLCVMDRDGSNQATLFPDEGSAGLDPQQVVWSPAPVGDPGRLMIAVIYQGNIWLVSPQDGTAQQVTGDGLAARVDWR